MSSTADVSTAGTRSGLQRWYFPVCGALLLALTLVAFGDNLFTRVGQPSNRDPKFIVHGLFSLAWMVLFLVQATMVRRGRLRLHRTLGIATMLVAIGVTLSTIHVFVAVWKGWDALDSSARANRLLLPAFAGFVFLAWSHRRQSDWHKRWVYIATLCMLGPVLSRAFDPLVVSWLEPFLPPSITESQGTLIYIGYLVIVWNAFFVSLFAYDRVVRRRIHPASLIGLIAFQAIWAVVLIPGVKF